jgi:hypothetical protein
MEEHERHDEILFTVKIYYAILKSYKGIYNLIYALNKFINI